MSAALAIDPDYLRLRAVNDNVKAVCQRHEFRSCELKIGVKAPSNSEALAARLRARRAYDGVGRMTSADSFFPHITYSYDVNNNRLGQRNVNGEVRFVYNHLNRIDERIGRDGSVIRYRYDLRGNVTNREAQRFLYDYSEQRGGAWAFIYTHSDRLGSIQSATKQDGSIDFIEFKTPNGRTISRDNKNDNQARYTGHIEDTELDMSYMQARFYDPAIRRFLSVDPVTFLDVGIPAQFNRYSYAYNDPINNIDPDGQLTGKAVRFGFKTLKHKGNIKKAGKETLVEIGDALAELTDGDLSTDDVAAVIDLLSPISTKDVSNGKKALDARKATRNRRSKNHRKNKRKSNQERDQSGNARKDRDSRNSDGVGGKGGSRKSRKRDQADQEAREEVDRLIENIRNDNLPEP